MLWQIVSMHYKSTHSAYENGANIRVNIWTDSKYFCPLRRYFILRNIWKLIRASHPHQDLNVHCDSNNNFKFALNWQLNFVSRLSNVAFRTIPCWMTGRKDNVFTTATVTLIWENKNFQLHLQETWMSFLRCFRSHLAYSLRKVRLGRRKMS